MPDRPCRFGKSSHARIRIFADHPPWRHELRHVVFSLLPGGGRDAGFRWRQLGSYGIFHAVLAAIVWRVHHRRSPVGTARKSGRWSGLSAYVEPVRRLVVVRGTRPGAVDWSGMGEAKSLDAFLKQEGGASEKVDKLTLKLPVAILMNDELRLSTEYSQIGRAHV